MSAIAIRPATPDDAERLAASNVAMALETEGKRLLPEVIGRGVRRILADASMGFYLVAEVGGHYAGCLMVTYEWSDWRCGRFWYIQSVYIAPAHRRRGVFPALYAHLGALAKQDPDVCGFRLYVERDNARAQATYASLGMTRTDYLLLEQLKPGVVYCEPAPGKEPGRQK